MLWWTLQQLKSKDSNTRSKAAEKLIAARDVNNLIAALKDKSYPDPGLSAWALGQIGRESVEPLVNLLKEDDASIRRLAVETLAKIGDKQAVGPICMMLNDSDLQVVRTAAEALGKFGDARTVRILLEVRARTREAERFSLKEKTLIEIEKALAEVLEKDQAAVDELLAALKDKPSHALFLRYVVSKIASSLRKIKDVSTVNAKHVELCLMILQIAVYDQDLKLYDVKNYALEALGEIGDERAVEPIVNLIKRGEIDHRKGAEALGKIGDERTVKLLVAALKEVNCSDSVVQVLQEVAPNWSKSITDSSVVPSLLAVVKKKSQHAGHDQIRKDAMRALGNIGDARAVEPLLMEIKNVMFYGNEVQKEAILTLGKIGDPQAVEPLLALLKQGSAVWHVATALGMIGDVRAVEPLVETLEHSNNHEARSAVAKALCQLGDSRAIRPLVEYCKKGIVEYHSRKDTAKVIIDSIQRVLETNIKSIPTEVLQTVGTIDKVSETLVYSVNEWGGSEKDERRDVDASRVRNLALLELARRKK